MTSKKCNDEQKQQNSWRSGSADTLRDLALPHAGDNDGPDLVGPDLRAGRFHKADSRPFRPENEPCQR